MSDSHPHSTNEIVDFPESAYRFVLLDSSKPTINELFAVYKHQDENIWCVLQKSDIMNTIKVYLFSENTVEDYIYTDMECLINLITTMLQSSVSFIIKGKKKGSVSDAYNLIES